MDGTLGRTLSGAQRAVGSGDPARVILAVLAVANGTPTDALRQWLRSRGTPDVRALASSHGAFRDLVTRSERYLAGYSPEMVRERTSHRIVPALSLGLPANEAALLALIACDMIDSGKDGALLTRAFSVAMNSTQKSITNRADSLAGRRLLAMSSKQIGVPTRVRLRRTEATVSTEATTALIEDLAAGTDSELTETFFAVRSPALSYADLGYDAWYLALCDALGIRKEIIPASRSSRARSRMRDQAGTDNLLDALRVLETSEVIEARDAVEAERAAVAVVRAESATETRARKAAGWKFVEDIAPLPRRASPIEIEDDDDDKPARVRKTRDFPTFLSDAKKVAGDLDPGVRRYAADALMQTLRRRDWDAAKIEKTIDTIFPDHSVLRWVAAHGAIPTERAEFIAWVAKTLSANDAIPAELCDHLMRTRRFDEARLATLEQEAAIVKRTERHTLTHGVMPTDPQAFVTWMRAVRADMRDDEVVHLRRLVVRGGIARSTATAAFSDCRLAKFYAERGNAPMGTDIAGANAFVNAKTALAPKRALASLRDDLESAGWSTVAIDRALPHLIEKGTDNV